MREDAKRKGSTSTLKGYLLVDEMANEKDMQIVKRGKYWTIVGPVHIGLLCNNFEELLGHRSKR